MAGRVALVAIAALGAAMPRGASSQPAGAEPAEVGKAAPAASAPGSAGARAAGDSAAVAAPARDPRLARKSLAQAQRSMARGSYLAARNRTDEARSQFENAVTAYHRAIEVTGDANLYLDLANAEDKLGKSCDAVKHLRLVTRASAGARPEVIKKATARLDELAAKVGIVTLIVQPAGASVTLGGSELGTAPLPEPLVLLPGRYTLSFQAEGFQPREAELAVEAGTEAERTIELERVKLLIAPVAPVAPGDATGPVPSAPGPSAPVDGGGASSGTLPLYLGAGATAAAAINATVFGVLAVRQHTTFTAASTAPLAREDARSNGRRLALVADVSLGAAVVAAGFTAYWYFYRYHPPGKHARSSVTEYRRRPAVETKLDVVPWVQPRSGGAVIAGWF